MNGTPSSYVFRSYSTVLIDSGPYAVALFCTVSRIRGDLQGIRGTQGGPQRRLACSAAVLRPSWCGRILQGISSIVEPSPSWQVVTNMTSYLAHTSSSTRFVIVAQGRVDTISVLRSSGLFVQSQLKGF